MAMYLKDLTEELKLRISKTDMEFLKELSEKRGIVLSELVRGIISEYKRSLELMEAMQGMLKLAKEQEIKLPAEDKKE